MGLFKIIDRTIEALLFVSLFGMIAVVALQIYARFFLDSAPPWTEESARVFFIYSIAFGAGLAIRDQAYVALDSFLDMLKPNTRKIVRIIILSLILALMLITLYYSAVFVQIGQSETAPSLGIRMSLVFGSMFVLSLLVVYYTGIEIIRQPFTKKEFEA